MLPERNMLHLCRGDVQPAPDQARAEHEQQQQAERGVQENQFQFFRTARQLGRLRGNRQHHDYQRQHRPVKDFTYRSIFFFGVFDSH